MTKERVRIVGNLTKKIKDVKCPGVSPVGSMSTLGFDSYITGATIFTGSFLFEKVSSNSFYILAAEKFASREKIRLVENRLEAALEDCLRSVDNDGGLEDWMIALVDSGISCTVPSGPGFLAASMNIVGSTKDSMSGAAKLV